jgi:hypothetical protein
VDAARAATKKKGPSTALGADGPDTPPLPSPASAADALGADGPDPRWDDAGFNKWADEAKLQFILLGYLRTLHKEGKILPAAQWIPRHAYHAGAPPSGVEIYNVIHIWGTKEHPDPQGDHLADLVEHLKDAHDSDLVLMEFCARPQRHYTAAGDGSHTRSDGSRNWTDLTVEQERRSRAFEEGSSRTFWNVTYSGLRTVVLHRMPDRSLPAEHRGRAIHESVWVTAELMLAAFCQRIVNASDPEVNEHLAASSLMNPVQRLLEDYHSHSGQLLGRSNTQVSALERKMLKRSRTWNRPSAVKNAPTRPVLVVERRGRPS